MIKFDTRDKKPKLWNIAILSGAAVLIMLLLLLSPLQTSLPLINGVIVVYVLLVLFFLVTAFFKQLQYNPYSYNTIYYMGFSLFLLSVFISHLVVEFSLLSSAYLTELQSIVALLRESAHNYMLYSAPFVLVFSIALFISNISLLKHEGKRFVNFLGMILAVLMVAGEVFLFIANYYAAGSREELMRHDLVVSLFAALYLYFECMVIGAIVANTIAATYDPEKNKDYILILGCSLRKDGTPTPLLAGRIDRALQFYKQQLALTGKAPVLVPSGGKGLDERHSESTAMTQYLLDRGVPPEHILQEDQSTNTYENMLFSKEKIQARNQNAKIAFSTTNYHVFRSGLMARRVKMRAVGMGAKTKWYFWPNASVREFVGLLQQHKGKQALIIGSMIVIYILLTIWSYQLQ